MISLALHSTDRAEGDSISERRAMLGTLGRDSECFAAATQRADSQAPRQERRSRWATIYAALDLSPGRL